MSVELLERAAEQLGPLVKDVAFVGGASLFLWIDDPGAPEPRATIDVDVIVVVDGRADYYRLSERLRRQGFTEDDRNGVICRWRGADELILDVMPTDPEILGFTNRWYEGALEAAQDVRLPSGALIRAVTPPYLLAAKLEAFHSRGRDDYLGSADFEDIVRLVDGREALMAAVEAAAGEIRAFIRGEFGRMLEDPRFEPGVAGALLPDAASQARLTFVLERFRQLSTAS